MTPILTIRFPECNDLIQIEGVFIKNFNLNSKVGINVNKLFSPPEYNYAFEKIDKHGNIP